MNTGDKELMSKFTSVIGQNIDDQAALDFFANLSKSEYERLINIFQNNDLPGILPEMKQKILLILEKLKEKCKNTERSG